MCCQGIREIRAPLAAGYLWLLCGWLVLDLPSGDELDAPVREVVDLAQRVPDSVVAIAVSFAAYLIGSLSEDLFTRLSRRLPAARQLSVEPLSRREDLPGPAPGGGDALSIATCRDAALHAGRGSGAASGEASTAPGVVFIAEHERGVLVLSACDAHVPQGGDDGFPIGPNSQDLPGPSGRHDIRHGGRR